MDELLASSDQPAVPKVGDVVEATVISVSNSEVYLDIEGLTTGIVRGRELIDESGLYSDLKVGDKAQATVLEIENEKCEMELSFRQAGHQKAWENLEKLMNEGTVIGINVTEANKGGLMVQVGKIDGFLPVSQLTVEHYPRVEGGDKSRILEKLNQFINTELKVKVIDVDEKEGKLIVSEKAAWEQQQEKVISQYKVGDIINGTITGVVDFGAFIEFGDNLEGLVHISELAWQRIDSPSDYVKVGDKVKAKIISIDGSRISLSLKSLQVDPWQKATEKYKIGQPVKGKVIKINPFGIFVELDKEIHGLAHISELSSDRINNPSDVVKVGESYTFKILSIEPDNHRLGLSMKVSEDKVESTPVAKELAKEAPDAKKPEVKKSEEKSAKGGSQPKVDPSNSAGRQPLIGEKTSSGKKDKK